MKKQKKITKKFFEVSEPVFLSNVLISIGHTQPEVNRKLKRMLKTDLDIKFEDDFTGYTGQHIVITSSEGDNQRIIWIKEFSWTVEDIAVMTHEILHLTTRILEDKLVPIKDNSEVMSYLHEFYVREILRKVAIVSNGKV